MSFAEMEKWRADFPLLATAKMHGKPLVYLDTGATSQKPAVVIETLQRFYASEYATVHRAIYQLSIHSTEAYDQARRTAQTFLNARFSEEIIFTRGTTESINCIASIFGKTCVQAGDEILITAMEHHSNIVPWQMLCQERGARLVVAPITDEGVLDLVAFRKLIHPKTRLVAITHLSNVLGTLNPIQEIVAYAHAQGAQVLVDGAQAAPHLPVDVQALDCDFYVCSGHKLYGPNGIGLLYGKKEWLEALPPYQGGGDMIESVTFEKSTYTRLPLKFEAGTPIIAEAIGLGTALHYLQQIGLKEIANWETFLYQYALEKIQALPGIRVIGTAPQKGAVLSFVAEGIHPLDLGTLLDLEGIAIRTGHLCAQPLMVRFGVPAVARASFGLYNNFHDIDRFIEALKNALQQLR